MPSSAVSGVSGAALSTSGQGPLLGRLLSLAWRYRAGCLGLLALAVLEILLTLVGLRALGLGIDVIRYAHAPDQALATEPVWPFGLTAPQDWSPAVTVAVLAGLILAVAVLTMVTRYASAVVAAVVMQGRLVVDLRRQVYDRLQRLSFRFYDANETGSIINRVTSDVQGMREFVEVVVLQSLTAVVSLLIYLVYMLQIHVPLTLACLATVPVMAWISVRFSRRVRPVYRQSREDMDALVRHLVEDVQGIHVVKGFAIEEARWAGFAAGNQRVRERREAIFRQISRFVPTIHLLSQINIVVLLGFGGWLVIDGRLGLGSGLVVFAGLLQQLAVQVQNLAQITNAMQNSLTGAQRVFEVLDAPVTVSDRPGAVRRTASRGAIHLEQVSFAYRPGEPVLRDIDLAVAAGSCVAVLGETGSGKSSLLALIPRFYDPLSGRICLDGVDLRDWRLDDLRRQVGVVFQENFLFSTTVAANIAFGCPQASPEAIERAARIACAHDFISDLPQGYQTVVGERGASLSGGQRQRIAIARAIIHDPRILLLDDATAAIDPETEHEIMQAMESAMAGRTTLIVAHRLSTLRRADEVVVLEHGRIIERGTHDQLMALAGRYQEAASLQQPRAESRRLLATQEDA